MVLKRLLPILALFTALVFAATPALAEEAPQMEPALDSATAPEVTAVEVETELEKSAHVDVLSLLGLKPAFDVSAVGYISGYCYHDCSPCESRQDCVEPGFPYGWPCTEIPLC